MINQKPLLHVTYKWKQYANEIMVMYCSLDIT